MACGLGLMGCGQRKGAPMQFRLRDTASRLTVFGGDRTRNYPAFGFGTQAMGKKKLLQHPAKSAGGVSPKQSPTRNPLSSTGKPKARQVAKRPAVKSGKSAILKPVNPLVRAGQLPKRSTSVVAKPKKVVSASAKKSSGVVAKIVARTVKPTVRTKSPPTPSAPKAVPTKPQASKPEPVAVVPSPAPVKKVKRTKAAESSVAQTEKQPAAKPAKVAGKHPKSQAKAGSEIPPVKPRAIRKPKPVVEPGPIPVQPKEAAPIAVTPVVAAIKPATKGRRISPGKKSPVGVPPAISTKVVAPPEGVDAPVVAGVPVVLASPTEVLVAGSATVEPTLRSAGAGVVAQPSVASAPVVPSPAQPKGEPVFIKSSWDGSLIQVPPILLEGDSPQVERVLAGTAPREDTLPVLDKPVTGTPQESSVGTLHLTPRDPRCLYADWDLPFEQQMACNAESVDQHLVLRVHEGVPEGATSSEMHLHPDSRHWFVHVDRPGVPYVAELGYATTCGAWVSLAKSEPVSTPSVGDARQTGLVEFVEPHTQVVPPAVVAAQPQPEAAPAVLEQPVPSPALPMPVVDPVGTGEIPPPPSEVFAPVFPVAARVDPLLAGDVPAAAVQGTLPAPTWIPVTAPVWPAGGQQALPELLERISGRRSAIGSAEINELLKPGVVAGDELSSVGLAAKHAARESCSSDSNPVPPEAPGGPGFWLQVNAELVVYGATDPSARVTIGGHPIRLRPDGSFSYRFALPDGAYELPIVAVAAHGDERSAAMRFSRGTEYSGEVGAHPQCASLKPPVPDSVQ